MTKRQYIGFAALQISYWCFHASFICFASAFFLDRCIGNTVVSLLLAGYMLCGFFGSFVWGALCDALGTNKRVFILGLTASAVLMGIIYACVNSTAVLAVAYPLMGFFFMPQSANADAWLLSACKRNQKIFGAIRSTPSIVYAVWAAVMGRLIAELGYSVMPIGATAFFVAVIAAAIILPDSVSVQVKEKPGFSGENLVRLFSTAEYRKLVVVLLFIGIAIAPINNLKIVMLESVGGNVSHVGVDSFASAMTQVPFFLMAGVLARIPLRLRYMLMTGLPLGMILMCLFAKTPMMVIFGSVIYNAGFGILLPTMREITERYVDTDLRNLGHNLTDAVFNSLSGVISLLYAGALVDAFGVRALILLSCVIGSVGMIIGCFKGVGKKTNA